MTISHKNYLDSLYFHEKVLKNVRIAQRFREWFNVLPSLEKLCQAVVARNEQADWQITLNKGTWGAILTIFVTDCSCINQVLQDHCEIKKIVTTGEAGGKKDVWGCLEQHMINKTILQEVIKHKRSVVMDSVPNEWLLIALKLAKVPPLVISVIETLMQKWSTNLHLTGHEGNIR